MSTKFDKEGRPLKDPWGAAIQKLADDTRERALYPEGKEPADVIVARMLQSVKILGQCLEECPGDALRAIQTVVSPLEDSITSADYSEELYEVAKAALEWIDSVPEDTPLPAMPGFDRDWADSVLDKVRSKK